MRKPISSDPVKVAVVTGGHSFDVMGFHELLKCLEGIEAVIQHMDDFAGSAEQVRDAYGTVVFFTMLKEGPADEGLPSYRGRPRTALEHLGSTDQGIVLLHHGILAYPDWPVWNDIVGIADRRLDSYHHGQQLSIRIANPDHPITLGVAHWEMVDETYAMSDTGKGSDVLLTVSQPESMTKIAWTRRHREARVFCCQSGHDARAWEHPGFRETLKRGILWTAHSM